MTARHRAALLALLLSSTAADTQQEELPHAAAHKQIVYRYIPIDKSFLNLDRAYDDYYRTSPVSENARRDYTRKTYNGRLDSYDQLYNKDYRTRNDYSDYYNYESGTGSSGEVDTYSSYTPAKSHNHGLSGSRRHTHDYTDYYDYDDSQDYTSTRRPQRRSKKKRKKKKSTAARVLDFAEAMIRRMWSPRDSGGGYGHKGHHKKKKRKPKRPRFKWPRFISFDAVMRFLSYILAVAAVIGYILLVTLNAAASDGLNNILGRSLDSGDTHLVNGEALRLVQLVDEAIARYRDGDCGLCRRGRDARLKSEA